VEDADFYWVYDIDRFTIFDVGIVVFLSTYERMEYLLDEI
jgi:hypothetical protein